MRDLRTVIYKYLISEVSAIDAHSLDVIASSVASEIQANGLKAYRPIASHRGSPRVSGSTAIISIGGAMTHRPSVFNSLFGGISIQEISSQLNQALSDPSVKAIVLDVDSPGGTVVGVPELADQLLQARAKKPITAVANSLMASAAYWLGSCCTRLVCSPSSQVGSVGVFAVHSDLSGAYEKSGVRPTLVGAGRYKTEGNPYNPLGDEAKAAMQAMVDDYYGMFTRAIAKGRNVSVDAVRRGFGEGRLVTAPNAVKLGMADSIGTLDQVLGDKIRSGRSLAASSSMATLKMRLEIAEAEL